MPNSVTSQNTEKDDDYCIQHQQQSYGMQTLQQLHGNSIHLYYHADPLTSKL